MLELYFSSPTRLRQMRRGPLTPQLDALAAELHGSGYKITTARDLLSLMGQFNYYLHQHQIEISALDESLGTKFIEEELRSVGDFKSAHNMLWHLLGHLRRHGIIPSLPEPPEQTNDIDRLLISYRRHLEAVKGLTSSSCEGLVAMSRRFLNWHVDRHHGLALGRIDGPEILEFISYACAIYPDSQSWPAAMASSTRSFLRYLRWEALIDHDLDRVVPPIPKYRLANVPKHLPWQQIRMVIDSVETHTPAGKRDKAILLLLATLGLRSYDVVSLELCFIDWHQGIIRLPKTKSRRERVLPMPQEVGDAIAEYILNGRPPLATPYIFVSHRAPLGPYKQSNHVSQIAHKYLKRAGVKANIPYSAHLFRFSLATHLVNHGTRIKDIADILDHVCIDTTAIYTKVDLTHLADVALPMPEVTNE